MQHPDQCAARHRCPWDDNGTRRIALPSVVRGRTSIGSATMVAVRVRVGAASTSSFSGLVRSRSSSADHGSAPSITAGAAKSRRPAGSCDGDQTRRRLRGRQPLLRDRRHVPDGGDGVETHRLQGAQHTLAARPGHSPRSPACSSPVLARLLPASSAAHLDGVAASNFAATPEALLPQDDQADGVCPGRVGVVIDRAFFEAGGHMRHARERSFLRSFARRASARWWLAMLLRHLLLAGDRQPPCPCGCGRCVGALAATGRPGGGAGRGRRPGPSAA